MKSKTICYNNTIIDVAITKHEVANGTNTESKGSNGLDLYLENLCESYQNIYSQWLGVCAKN